MGDRGRALPFAWVSWPAQQPQPQASWTDCQTLRAQAAILPAGPSVTAGQPKARSASTVRVWQSVQEACGCGCWAGQRTQAHGSARSRSPSAAPNVRTPSLRPLASPISQTRWSGRTRCSTRRTTRPDIGAAAPNWGSFTMRRRRRS